jgi:adenine/guanine phosphoribosyltransferase-like PRPP-binding protein
MHTPNYVHTYYLTNAIQVGKLRERLKRVAELLADVEFDAVAFRGMSGCLFAAPLALLMDKTLIGVRKEDELPNCHSVHIVEGDRGAHRYIIIDDCVSSGRTVREMRMAIRKFAPHAVFVGVAVYDSVRFDTEENYPCIQIGINYGYGSPQTIEPIKDVPTPTPIQTGSSPSPAGECT